MFIDYLIDVYALSLNSIFVLKHLPMNNYIHRFFQFIHPVNRKDPKDVIYTKGKKYLSRINEERGLIFQHSCISTNQNQD